MEVYGSPMMNESDDGIGKRGALKLAGPAE
jgi:hypothetical protein